MQYSQIPTKISVPWGASAGGGYITTVPIGSQIGIQNGRASYTDGFPPLNFLPVGAGGVPPFGQDMNGVLNAITLWTQWQAAGALTKYDAAFSTAIGGYPFGALLASTTAGIVWLCTADNNTNNPDTGGANWVNLGGNVSQISVGLDGGSSNVMTATVAPAPTAYNDGAIFVVQKANQTNNGNMTGNINGLGSRPIVMPDGSAMVPGAWVANASGLLEYNAARSSLVLLNPTATAATTGGLSATAEGIFRMNISGLPGPTGAISLTDLLPVKSTADGTEVKQPLSALIALLGTNTGRIVGMQEISSAGAGTWTKPVGVNGLIAFATGSGGAGGGDPSTQSGVAGYGGASGGTAAAYIDVSAVASVSYNIGAGGTGVSGADGNSGNTTNFGIYAVATGGAGGWNSAKANSNTALLAPQPGTATTGFNFPGNPGNPPPGGGTPIGDIPGNGGASFWGGAGQGQRSPSTSNLNGGPGSRGGGGGGGDHQAGLNSAGGNGGDGYILLLLLS